MTQIQNMGFRNPAIKLLALIAQGLQTHATTSTASQFGDRSSYVGMFDIGLMQECPRLAVLHVNPLLVCLYNYSNRL